MDESICDLTVRAWIAVSPKPYLGVVLTTDIFPVKGANTKIKSVILVANRVFALTSSRLPLVEYFRNQGWRVFAAAAEGASKDRLIKAGAEFVNISFYRGGLNPVNDLKAFSDLMRLYKRVQPDLIHHFNAKPTILGGLAAYLTCSASIVASITGLGHAFIEESTTRYFSKVGYRKALRHTDRVIFQNRDDQELFIDQELVNPKNSRLIISSGVDTEKYKPLNLKSNSSTEVVTVLMITRLLWEKGVAEYIEAAEKLRSGHPDVRFVLGGEFDPAHPNAVDELYVERKVSEGVIEFMGYIHDMPQQLNRADIFVLPSYREGAPRVILEASSVGIPVIVADAPGSRELVKDRFNGLMVPPRDSQALSEAIRLLLEDPERREELGKNGRTWMVEEFDQRKIIDRILDIYREVGVIDD